jgi:hypothetical protein
VAMLILSRGSHLQMQISLKFTNLQLYVSPPVTGINTIYLETLKQGCAHARTREKIVQFFKRFTTKTTHANLVLKQR